jgi:membrane protease YdiL (CAAX protease family)
MCMKQHDNLFTRVHSAYVNGEGGDVKPWKLIFVFVWCAVARCIFCIALLPYSDGYYLDMAAQVFQHVLLFAVCIAAFHINHERMAAIFGQFNISNLWAGIGLAVLLVALNGGLTTPTAFLGHADMPLAFTPTTFAGKFDSAAPLFPVHLALFLLANVLMTAVIEEFFFRGLLFPALAQRRSLYWSALLCSMAFTFAHLGEMIDAKAFLLSLVLLVVYAKQGSLFTCIIAHAGYNLLTFAGQYHALGDMAIVPQWASWLLSALILMWLLYRQLPFLRLWRTVPGAVLLP